MSRQRPWRADNPDAIICARPSRWGNPWTVGAEIGPTNGITLTITHELAVALHRAYVIQEDAIDEIREVLGGHDLACWCPLDQPCHVDTYLEIANS